MSNHYHIILKITEENLDKFFQFVNSRIAMMFNIMTNRSGHLWGDRYRSTIIESDEHYIQCVRYIYENPVRANISDSPADFEHSTFHFHAFGKEVDVEVVKDELIVHLPSGKHKGVYTEAFLNIFKKEDYSPVIVGEGLRRRFFGSLKFISKMELLYPV